MTKTKSEFKMNIKQLVQKGEKHNNGTIAILGLLRLVRQHRELISALHEAFVLTGIETRSQALENVAKKTAKLMNSIPSNNYMARLKQLQQQFMVLTTQYQNRPIVQYDSKEELVPISMDAVKEVTTTILEEIRETR